VCPASKACTAAQAHLLISVNEEVVHGLPGIAVLKEGDVASVDCGVLMNGFYGDSAYTFCVGEVAAG
jgi:methionyl aminopeptidase